MIGSLHFGHPGFAGLLLLVVVVALLLVRLARHREMARRLLGMMVRGRSKRVQAVRGVLACVVLVAGLVVLMDPIGNPHPVPDAEKETTLTYQEVTYDSAEEEVIGRQMAHDIVFVLDTSASMMVGDTRQGQSRLEVGKEIIDQMCAQFEGQSASLYAFTSELTPLVPSTMDYLYFRLLLRRVGVNEGDVAGTDLLEALDQLKARGIFQAKDHKTTVVVLTDGGDTRLEMASKEDRTREIEAILSRVDAGETIKTYCIGLGSHSGEIIPDIVYDSKPVRSSLDEDLLVRLASYGRGKYFFAGDYSSYTLAEEILKDAKVEPIDAEVFVEGASIEQTVTESIQIEYDHYFRAFLLLAIGALLIELSLSKLHRGRV